MKVLGLEASGIVASVALVEDNKLIAEYTINNKRTHSKTLMPMLDEMRTRIDADISDIDVIAVASGPGSYTGLRISSATAKGLGMALNKPIVSVPTMEGMAYNMWGANGYICPIVDARRSQVYTGTYYFEDGNIIEHTPTSVVLIEDLLSSLCKMLSADDRLYDNIVFLGDGVNLHHDLIVEKLGDKCTFAPAHMNMPSAASIAALGVKYAACGDIESASEHRPSYYMLSQAEKERLDEGKDIVEPSDY